MIDPLSIRLQMVYDSIDRTKASKGRVIDVGSDHGLLALSCLKNSITPYCICTDIHKLPAERTDKCLKGHNLSGSYEVYCTDGLVGIDLKPNDTVVMAGLGGNTIMSVMSEVISRTSKDILKEVDFVLQPQKTSDELRVYLVSNGFSINSETATIDRDLFYQLIMTSYTGEVTSLTPEEKYYGPVLLRSEKPEIKKFHDHLDEVYKLRSRGNPELRKVLEERHVL